MNNWFFMQDNSQQGPISEEELKKKIESNEINSDTYVWKDGMTDWQAIKEVEELNQKDKEDEGPVPFSESAVCEHCNTRFAKKEMMQYEDKYICSSCKPQFAQKLREGVSLGLGNFVYGGFWKRFVAIFIDGIIFSAVNLVFTFITGAVSASGSNVGLAAVIAIINVAASIILPMAYEIYFIGTKGATLGKMAMGLKVISSNGKPVSMGQAAGRYFAKMLSGLTLGIGYLMAAFNDEKKTLHDIICETRVVLA